jgi:hypothetical protein
MDLCRQPSVPWFMLYRITIAHAKYPVLSCLCIPKCTTSVQYSIVKKPCTVPPLKTTGRAEDWRTVLCSICLSSLHFSWEHKHKQRESKICVLKWNYFKHSECCMRVIKRQLRRVGSTQKVHSVVLLFYTMPSFLLYCIRTGFSKFAVELWFMYPIGEQGFLGSILQPVQLAFNIWALIKGTVAWDGVFCILDYLGNWFRIWIF